MTHPFKTKNASKSADRTELAAFAAGCFWGVEEEFRKESGVLATAVGYMGGHSENPTYEQVCDGDTGHAEAVLIEYDPLQITYQALLELFWNLHDPTTLNRQGPDRGEQYRSVIFYYSPAQKEAALISKDQLQKSGELRSPIVTEIVPSSTFNYAEDYHQQYVEKGGHAVCHFRKKNKRPPQALGIISTMSNPTQDAFQKQRAHHPSIKALPISERIRKLQALRAAILARESEIQKALELDFRKAPAEVSISEVYPVLVEIDYTIKHLKKWACPSRVRTPLAMFTTRSEIWYEPKGVVLIIGPFNYPFYLVFAPLLSAIAAGNCVMIKPSELTPNTSRLTKELLAAAFDEKEIAVFEGQTDVATALLELPFDHILFTGSPRVGKIVMAAAAKNLTPVTLELGGKSPAIIDESADLREAATRIVWGKYFNGGQTCIAPDYVMVARSQKDAFIEEAKKVVAKNYGEDEASRKKSVDFPRIINAGNFQRIKKLIESSIAGGAKLAIGGIFDETERYIAPTILDVPTRDLPVMSEEIFGPVMPVITYDSIDEACKFISAGEKPLSLYVFGRDRAAIRKVIATTTAGGTTVNNTMIHITNPNVPFGGVGNSGMGSYHGIFGFKTFSHERAILRQGPIDTVRLMYPPYGSRVKRVIALMIRFLT